MRSVAPCMRGWRAQSPVAPSTASWPIPSSSRCPRRRLASPPSRRPETRSTLSPAPPLRQGEEETRPAPSPTVASYPSELLSLLLLLPISIICHPTNRTVAPRREVITLLIPSFCTHAHASHRLHPPFIAATLCFS